MVCLALPESLWDQRLNAWSLGAILKFVVDEIFCDAGNVTCATRKCIEYYCVVI